MINVLKIYYCHFRLFTPAMSESYLVCPYNDCQVKVDISDFNYHVFGEHEKLGEIDSECFQDGLQKFVFDMPSKLRVQDIDKDFILDFPSEIIFQWKLGKINILPFYLGNSSIKI